jgi:hypothetical protein
VTSAGRNAGREEKGPANQLRRNAVRGGKTRLKTPD